MLQMAFQREKNRTFFFGGGGEEGHGLGPPLRVRTRGKVPLLSFHTGIESYDNGVQSPLSEISGSAPAHIISLEF